MFATLIVASLCLAQTPPPISAELDALYLELHQTPELSNHEEKTSAKLAARLKALGYTVTSKVGGWGVVAVLKNGEGKTVLLRTDMDALPVAEQTGVPFASKATGLDPKGQTVPVMHACGHDLHMTAWVGVAAALAADKASWRGTVVFVAQPAEELVTGAKAMIADGLFTRFPAPDVTLAVHDSPMVPSGSVALVKGPAFAGVDTVTITLYGKGGHGAAPHTTVDPIVMAAKTVLSLQTIVSREMSPLEPAVVSVGSIHGGTKSNIIPDEVTLELTVRSYKPEVRQKLRDAITRIVKAEADAANAPKPPLIVIEPGAQPVVNDPALIELVTPALLTALGPGGVVEFERIMGAEDFGEYATAAHVPGLMMWVGATAPATLAELKAKGTTPPSTHSSRFLPDRAKALPTAITALTTCVKTLLRPTR